MFPRIVLKSCLACGIGASLFAAPLSCRAAASDTPVIGAAASNPSRVTTERVVVHAPSLEGNLEGDSADRGVIVYLPPSYETEKTRRYPVVYALHGYSINNEKWTTEIKTPQTIERAFAAGARDMIVVLPNAQTLHNGSMYSSSVTIGDWETFIARDLVSYVDAHYRTIPDRKSRGLAGHSMGGYGTIRIGMKHPEVFGSLYIMSPCCLSARGAPTPQMLAKLEAVKSPAESTSLGFFERATLATAAAWSPNPKKPPFYFDLPSGNGAEASHVLAEWAANAPLAMLPQYVFNLRQYEAIAIDVGDRDGLRYDARRLHQMLTDAGIGNTFEIYNGDHVSAVADRFQNHVMPFFSKNLVFE